MASAQQATIHYSLGMSKPSTHFLEVEITFDHLPDNLQTLDVVLPVWRPGRYFVLDLASGVQEFSAVDGKGTGLAFQKTEKSKWHVETAGASKVSLSYKVYANEFNLRTRGLNDEHAFIDGAAVFMYVEQFRNLPIVLSIKPYGNWHATTGLEGDGKKFTAPDYDYFVDCPIEIGNQKEFNFSVDGVPHVLSIFGQGNWNADTLVKDISAIVKAQKEFWGEFPYKRYVFLLHCTPSSGGGTEHINSTAMGTRPYVFKNPDSYRGFLGLVSHEYFHTWNVKQLRPKGIHPYDYTKENYTRELWIAEGTTSYYDNLLLVRAGFVKPEKYLERLAGEIQADRQRPGNTVQPVSESSFDAWVKYWKGTEQAYNSESDYYDKGADVSLLLDLEIRNMTKGARSLDDVMRAMYKRFPLKGSGYTLNDFIHVAEEIAGGSLQQFFTQYVYGITPLPWENALSYAGLQIAAKDSVAKPWTGAVTNDVGEKTKITRVIAGSPAYNTGVDIGDELLALNGNRVRSADFNDRIAELKVGDIVTLTLFHNDRLREIKIALDHTPVPAYKVIKITSPTSSQKELYKDWLKAHWE
jgi:predicted metalloprotease with PDZ domain